MKTSDLSFYNTKKYKLVFCLSSSVFFYCFLIFFLPFGIDNYNPFHEYTLKFLLEIFNFFLVVFTFLFLNEFLIRPIFVKNITLRQIVLWSIWTFVLLSTVIFLTYNFLGNWHDFYFKSYLGFIVNCSSVLIFPLISTFFFFRYKSLQQQFDHVLTSKEEPVKTNQLITFSGQGSKNQITLSISIFLYGRAQDNYVELFYLEQEKLTKFLIRASLGKLTDSIDNSAIARCHRSYMVNLLQVKAIKGGRTEISLHLDTSDTVIPVSKSYRESILNQLKTLKNFN